jgi:hypothetical protein
MALCYRDRWFCTAACSTEPCDRKLTEEISRKAAEFGLPIDCNNASERCPDYQPLTTET